MGNYPSFVGVSFPIDEVYLATLVSFLYPQVFCGQPLIQILLIRQTYKVLNASLKPPCQRYKQVVDLSTNYLGFLTLYS